MKTAGMRSICDEKCVVGEVRYIRFSVSMLRKKRKNLTQHVSGFCEKKL